MGRRKKTRIITIIGKRWFDKLNGNTYFSAVGIVNGDVVVTIQFEYGYESHYIDCIRRELERGGYLPNIIEYHSLSRHCHENGIKLNCFAIDVARRKDL